LRSILTGEGHDPELLGLTSKYLDVAIESLIFESSEMQNGNPFVQEILATGIAL